MTSPGRAPTLQATGQDHHTHTTTLTTLTHTTLTRTTPTHATLASQVIGQPAAVKHLDLHTCTIKDALGVEPAPFSFSTSPPAKVRVRRSE